MQQRQVSIAAAIVLALGASCGGAARANPFVLFRGTPEGALPVNQGALVLGALDASGRPALTSERGWRGGVTVETDAGGGIYAGYFNYNPLAKTFIHPEFPRLDRDRGFAVEFQVSLDRSSDRRRDRAGLSLTVIADDTRGIELAFEPDAIFAQSPTFARAEEVAIDTQMMRSYVLSIEGDRYQLSSAGEPLVAGQLRSYRFSPRQHAPPLLFNPYTTPGFIFVGDNTSSERAVFSLQYLAVSQ